MIFHNKGESRVDWHSPWRLLKGHSVDEVQINPDTELEGIMKKFSTPIMSAGDPMEQHPGKVDIARF